LKQKNYVSPTPLSFFHTQPAFLYYLLFIEFLSDRNYFTGLWTSASYSIVNSEENLKEKVLLEGKRGEKVREFNSQFLLP
jgi:hypothetical protein